MNVYCVLVHIISIIRYRHLLVLSHERLLGTVNATSVCIDFGTSFAGNEMLVKFADAHYVLILTSIYLYRFTNP